MSNVTQDARALFARYLECWNKRDLIGAAACYDEPAMFISPTDTALLPDRKALVAFFETMFTALEADGFSHSEIGTINATLCRDGLAVVDTTEVSRVRKDGSVIEGMDAHYVMRKRDGEWRLSVAVSCAPGWRNA